MNLIKIYTLALAFICIFTFSWANPDQQKTNVIIIFSDDLGYGDLACFGADKIKTPHLDKMAKEGMLFNNFYSASSVCSPARAGLLTGSYPVRIGVHRVLFPNREIGSGGGGLHPDEVTIADMLKTNDYQTMCVGKWHLGDKKQYLPTRQGFDKYYGIPYSNDMTIAFDMEFAENPTINEGLSLELVKKVMANPVKGNEDYEKVVVRDWVPLFEGEKCIEYPMDQSTLTKRFTEKSIEFITTNKDKPFFLYLAHSMPHIPLFTSKEFEGKSEGGAFGDVIEEMDWSTGEILKTLKDLGIDEKTLVIFTSDNGPWLSKGDQAGTAGPLRGGKFNTTEGGQRVPCIMRWPTHIPAGKVNESLASTLDFLPTIAKLTSSDLPTNKIDGKDISDVMKGKSQTTNQSIYFYKANSPEIHSIRRGKWKYLGPLTVKSRKKNEKGKFVWHKENFPESLYNLDKDIGESQNVISQYPEISEMLKKEMESFDSNLKNNLRNGVIYK